MKYHEMSSVLNEYDNVLDCINKMRNNPTISKTLIILENCKLILSNIKKLECLFDDKIRYCDYYDDFVGYSQNMHFFDCNYLESDKEYRKILYALYCFVRNFDILASLILDAARMSEDIDLMSIVELIDIDDLKKYSDYVIDSIIKSHEEDSNEFAFLHEETMYKILFTGKSLEDLSKLHNNTIMQVVRKIENPLATEKIISKSEGIDHVRDAYNFPVFRIHVADDYRIAYLRVNNVTAIIGVTLKSGKDSDYTRYDSIARNKQQVYQEIELFSKNLLDSQHVHYKTIELLKSVIEKSRNKRSLK